MKRMLIALPLVLAAADAGAISRYTSTSMSCARVHATIQREGAAIMRYRSTRNPALPLYGRFVAGNGWCEADELAQSTTIPAADTKQCRVLECQHVDLEDDAFLPLWRHRRH